MAEKEVIEKRLQEHLDDALKHFDKRNIVGIFLQGSQNYNLDTPYSDVDTKLVVTPSLSDIVMGKNPVSTTFIRDNDEHIDFKDVRLMLQTFRKQNINFLEILFTKYKWINPMYKPMWEELEAWKEEIAHYNIFLNVKAQMGVAKEKYHAMEHRYPSRAEYIDKYGYDPKQLHHLLRIQDFLEHYIVGHSFEKCMVPTGVERDFLLNVKLGQYDLTSARELAKESIRKIEDMCESYTKDSEYNVNDEEVERVLNSVQERIMVKCIREELSVNEV